MGVPRRNFVTWMIFELLDADVPMAPLESTYQWLRRSNKIDRKKYRDSIRGMRERGTLRIIKKKDKEYIVLTKAGVLQVLLHKAKVVIQKNWDRKWRVIIFDIPEEFHLLRDSFRRLLRQNNFIKLQNSVFISPYSLSREALQYLKQTGLMEFIRIMKVEEMDSDIDLRKKFNV